STLEEVTNGGASFAVSSLHLLRELPALRIGDRDCQLRWSARTEKFERWTHSLGITEICVRRDRVLAVRQRVELIKIFFQRRRKCVLTFRPLDRQIAARRLASSCKHHADSDLTCDCPPVQLNVCMQQLVTRSYANVFCPQQVRRIWEERAGIRNICVETVVPVENQKVFSGRHMVKLEVLFLVVYILPPPLHVLFVSVHGEQFHRGLPQRFTITPE